MEEFIRKNRAAFENEVPPHSIWERIESDLHQGSTKMVSISWLYKVAAGVAIILSMGVLLGYYIGSQSQNDQIREQMVGIEKYYGNKLDQKLGQLANYNATDMVRSELAGLESGYAQLASETPLDQERYLRAVMANFEARLEVIEKVLMQMEKYSNEGKYNENEIRDIQI